MDKYIPNIGDSVIATRKVKTDIYANCIVGPVVDVWSNACRIVTNPGTEIETDFRYYFSTWNFHFLHRADSHQQNGCATLNNEKEN